MSDQELVKYCKSIDRQDQEVFYRAFADKMYGVSISYMKDESDACDVLQDAFIKIFRKINQYKDQGSLEGWVRRIVVNTALDHLKRKKDKQEFIDAIDQTIKAPLEQIIANISEMEIIKAVNELPEKAGLVLKLYAIEGFTHKEIAENIGISEGTSKSQLNRARTLLKQKLNNSQ